LLLIDFWIIGVFDNTFVDNLRFIYDNHLVSSLFISLIISEISFFEGIQDNSVFV